MMENPTTNELLRLARKLRDIAGRVEGERSTPAAPAARKLLSEIDDLVHKLDVSEPERHLAAHMENSSGNVAVEAVRGAGLSTLTPAREIDLQAALDLPGFESEGSFPGGFRGVFEALDDCLLVFDAGGRTLHANRAAQRALGFDPVGMSQSELVRKIDLRYPGSERIPADELPIQRALKGQRVLDERYHFTSPSGRTYSVITSTSPLLATGRKVTGVVMIWHDFTEFDQVIKLRAELDAENRRQRDLLERLIESAPAGIAFLSGPQHRYTLVNPPYERMARGKGSLVGRTVGEVWPEIAGEIVPILDQVYQSGIPYQGHDRVFSIQRGEETEPAHFTFTYAPFQNGRGEREGIIILAADVTEQALAREKIEMEEARLKVLFDNAPEGIVVTDRQGRINMANPAAEALFPQPVPFGQSYTTLSAFGFSRPDHTPFAPRDLPMTRSSLDGETHRNVEMLVQSANSQKKALLCNSAPIRNSSGRVIGAIAILQDISEIKRYQDALKESREQLLLTAQAAQIGFWSWDVETGELHWDERTREMFGLDSAETVTYQRFLEMVVTEERDALDAALQKVAVKHKTVDIQYRITRPDGTLRWMYARGEAITQEEGIRVVGVVLDVTDQKLAQQEVSESLARIEVQRRLIDQREQERQQIARDLHDGPLQELIGLSFMLHGAVQEAEGRSMAGTLKEVQKGISNQIKDLRNFAGELRPPALARFGLEQAIRSHIDHFEEKHPGIEVSFEAHQVGGLLPAPVRLALYRIYQEALNNMLRHSKATKVWIRMEKADYVELIIHDNGQGFVVPENWLDLARQGHLGLVGIRERAEAVGGEAWIVSSPERGTTVRVYVPLEEEEIHRQHR